MPKISSDDAIELAKQFRKSALAVGQFQLDHWDELSKAQRRSLTDTEYALLGYAQNLVTYAVGKWLDNAEASLKDIKKATAEANAAVEMVKDVKKVLTIATALVTLGAAIYTANPGGIATAVGRVLKAVKG